MSTGDSPSLGDRIAETDTVTARFHAGTIGEADALVALAEIWDGLGITYQGLRAFLYEPRSAQEGDRA